jgi:hypothetical protein
MNSLLAKLLADFSAEASSVSGMNIVKTPLESLFEPILALLENIKFL